MFEWFRKKAAPETFWSWLAANTVRIQADPRQDPGPITKEIRLAFKRSYPDLVWEISPSGSGTWGFCVSADGNAQLIPKVLDAVKSAPPLPGWRIQAFRCRGSLDAEIDLGGCKLGYDDIWCRVQPHDGGVNVALMIRGLSKESDEHLSSAALILLDNAIGEYDAMVKIKQLDRVPLAADPQKSKDFFPLRDLPEFLDNIETD
jgi:hypothetical protein